MGVWILDGVVWHSQLLSFVLKKETLPHTVVMIVADMSQPWSIMESLQRWADVVRKHIDSLMVLTTELKDMEANSESFHTWVHVWLGVVVCVWLGVSVCVWVWLGVRMCGCVCGCGESYTCVPMCVWVCGPSTLCVLMCECGSSIPVCSWVCECGCKCCMLTGAHMDPLSWER